MLVRMILEPAPHGEPGSPELAGVLRRAVLDFVLAERRRVFPPTLHVGRPCGAVGWFREPESPPRSDGPPRGGRTRPGMSAGRLDHALRTDIVAALLTRVDERPPVLVWLTRRGPLTPLSTDASWLSAVVAACGEAGLRPAMVVVTRRGWLDPRSGRSQTWRRLRQR